jgi:ABC-type nitrate/sulfonate/bicarbonate transport system substrate-binding protein
MTFYFSRQAGAALAFAVLLSSGLNAQELKTLNVLVPSERATSDYPVFVAEELGFYADEGLKVNFLPSDTTVPYLAFLMNSQADLVVLDPAQVTQAVNAGQEVSVIYEFMQLAPEGLAVPAAGPIKTIADLKGKRIGVTTAGSLTDWLSRELARQQGWGRDGMQVMPLGSVQARLAAMERGDLDALVIESATGFELEELKKGRIVLDFGDIEKNFYTHVIYATDNMVEKRTDALRRFLRGWFKTIAFIHANKAETVKITAKAIDVRESIVNRIYDAQVNGFSRDGAWDPVSIEVIRKSLKDLGILDSLPDARTIYNDKFVPVKF